MPSGRSRSGTVAVPDAHPCSSVGQSAALRMRRSQVRILAGVRARRRGGAGAFRRGPHPDARGTGDPAWFGTRSHRVRPAGIRLRQPSLPVGVTGSIVDFGSASPGSNPGPGADARSSNGQDAEAEVRTLDGQQPRLLSGRWLNRALPGGFGVRIPGGPLRPRGPTDTTPASEAGNAGSTPAGGTIAARPDDGRSRRGRSLACARWSNSRRPSRQRRPGRAGGRGRDIAVRLGVAKQTVHRRTERA